MRVNQPLTPEQHEQADEQHRKSADNNKAFLNDVADLIEAGEPLSAWQRKWAAAAVRAFSASIPLERTKPVGRQAELPEEIILLRQAYIGGGMKVTEAEEKLAAQYDVDPDKVRERIKDLSKK